ncbi:MAG TPA: outer membrane beta-barrel protein, partial [Gammaproteobacteria bacterium]|nr:outer membrane beta-barrel protein [Gammaproteobacteria bacterium]
VAGTTLDLDVTTLGAYGAYTLPVDRFRLHARLGLVYETIDVSHGKWTGSDSDTNLSWGFGGGYQVDDRLEVTLEYTRIEEHIDHLGVTGVYAF